MRHVMRTLRRRRRHLCGGHLTDDGRGLRARRAATIGLEQSKPRQALDRSQEIALFMVAERNRLSCFAGSRGAAWLTVAMALSALGALHVVVMTGARIPYAMARDGLFFRFATRIQPSFHTPSGALLFLGVIAALLALTGTFEELYSLFVFAVWIFFAMTAVALLRLRRTEPELVRPYRAWGYPWTPIIFLLAAIALTVNLWMMRPVRSTLGLVVIAAGVPFYYRWRRTAGSVVGSH